MSDPIASRDLAAAVGAHVRALREAQRLTLSELARRAGIGKATLSELEAGLRNPTLETLYGLTTALGVPLSAALPAPSRGHARARTVRGAAVDATLTARFDDEDATTELYRLRIRRGRTQRSAAHAPGVTEIVLVFRGVAVVGPAGAPITVEAGAEARWRADVEHVYATATDEDVAAALLIRYPGARNPDTPAPDIQAPATRAPGTIRSDTKYPQVPKGRS
jgi:XRE family transcriptional regulator, regulator of sulfur utilization